MLEKEDFQPDVVVNIPSDISQTTDSYFIPE